MRKLKKALLVIIILIISFFGYVAIANRNNKNMTYRQKVLKTVYPAFMWATKLFGTNRKALANADKQPIVPFYSMKQLMNNGTELNFASLKGKKVLLVNTASNCGYTNQYDDLQRLYAEQGDKLVIIGFPANDFKEQEKGSDEDIAQFCKLNYGVTFPLAKKSVVIRSADQNAVFTWLTDSTKNGWNKQAPEWNFSKYLVNENGVLTHYFGPSVSLAGEEIKKAISE